MGININGFKQEKFTNLGVFFFFKGVFKHYKYCNLDKSAYVGSFGVVGVGGGGWWLTAVYQIK